MPAYMEMLVSHSPPVYSHSPPTGFLTDFANSRPFDTPRIYRPTTLSPIPLRKQFSLPIKLSQPKRSCLVVKQEIEEAQDDTDSQRNNNNKNKKRVVFADDQGFQLTHVKVMNEASCEPPIWTLQFLAHVTQGLIR